MRLGGLDDQFCRRRQYWHRKHYYAGLCPIQSFTTVKFAKDANQTVYPALLTWPKLDSMQTDQQLSQKAIDEFKTAYFEEFAEHLTDNQAKEMALQLLCFLRLLQPFSGSPSGAYPPLP